MYCLFFLYVVSSYEYRLCMIFLLYYCILWLKTCSLKHRFKFRKKMFQRSYVFVGQKLLHKKYCVKRTISHVAIYFYIFFGWSSERFSRFPRPLLNFVPLLHTRKRHVIFPEALVSYCLILIKTIILLSQLLNVWLWHTRGNTSALNVDCQHPKRHRRGFSFV